MADRTKRQHVVPRFYLEQFADPEGMVWNYDFSTGEVAPRKAEKTAVEKNFYSPIWNEERYDKIETLFSQIESGEPPPFARQARRAPERHLRTSFF